MDPFFLYNGETFPVFIFCGNMPDSKDILIKYANEAVITSSTCFKIKLGMSSDPEDFLFLIFHLIKLIDLFLEKVSDTANVD